MKNKYDILIIGGGIIGASIAYELSKYDKSVLILEKNPIWADETSKGNSGVIHCGFDAESHKIEARLNVEGNELWQKEIFPHFTFPRAKVDSLVIAFNKEEMQHAYNLYERGLTNKVKKSHMKILDKEELLKKEPKLSKKVKGALFCNNSYAIDSVEATKELIQKAKQKNVEAYLNSEVTKIKFKNNEFEITINNKTKIIVSKVINAAGHYADTIAKMAGYPDFKQTTKRGEYRILDRTESKIVKNICFMMPTIHGKGVIVAPMLTGNILVGPTAEDGVKKEETRLTTPEKYNLIGDIAKKIIPSIKMDKTIMTLAGSRPIDIKTNDFVIGPAKKNLNFINAAGMQSPGLSSAPAIALEIVKHLKNSNMNLNKK